jgi:hypothetical protein
MKTPLQELIENLTDQLDKVVKEHPLEVSEDTYWRGVKIGLETTIGLTESLLEKERECIIEFAYKCRNVMAADEFAITKWYDKTFNTNEK